MAVPVILNAEKLGFQWRTFDPFLFCVHHDDKYPAGDDRMAPKASLAGRDIGQDFAGKDGWRMYHGDVVPGFPQHPHRGFETVTLARRGYIDHSDSLGATARFGHGDVQWLTTGRGVVHSEMFPLTEQAAPNPTELFQIWLNLPAKSKMVAPHFTMRWGPTIPHHQLEDGAGRSIAIVTVAGALGSGPMPTPPPHSWASDPNNEVAIWTITLAPGAKWTIPAASPGINRGLFAFRGDTIQVGDRVVPASVGMRLRPDAPAELVAGSQECELLLLQGRPIAEPVAQHGPFVMNTAAEIQQAFADYRRTQFGGWPWPANGPVHARGAGRFAIHADGHVEKPA